MGNEFLESCISDLRRNELLAENEGLDPSELTFMLSFPRSGNGWVRGILTMFFAAWNGKIVRREDLANIRIRSIKDQVGINTAALFLAKTKPLPIDMYVPDLYLYGKVRNALSCKRDEFNIPPRIEPIVKSHHLLAETSKFKSLLVILRHPENCVPSSALLLEDDLLDRSVPDIEKALDEYYCYYIRFLEQCMKLSESREVYFVDLEHPIAGLANWLANNYLSDAASYREVSALLEDAIACAPLKSGYDRGIESRVQVTARPLYDKALSLFSDLRSKSVLISKVKGN